MRKVISHVLLLLCVFSLAGCGKNATCELQITIPAGSQEAFVFSDEEISPTGDTITISAGKGMTDTEVLLQTVDELLTPGYVATCLTPGTPVEFDTVKGVWLRVGIAVQNPTDTDITVCVEVKGADIRIP